MIPTNQNPSPGEAPSDNHYRYESAAECEICSQLRDCEDGCDKEYKDALLLPPASYRLVSIPGPWLGWMGSLEKCPLCGTYYSYSHWYEYSPSGNDEEEHLRRLPAAEALADLCAGEIYSELEDFAEGCGIRYDGAGGDQPVKAEAGHCGIQGAAKPLQSDKAKVRQIS